MMSAEMLAKLKVPPFKPLKLLTNATAQTIIAAYLPSPFFVSTKIRHVISLSDGDKIVITENCASTVNTNQRIILLVHGLAGSHLSPYMIRLTLSLIKSGFRVMRMDLRGCGFGVGLAKHPYHSGRSEDTRQVIAWLAQHFPHSPVTQIGFSLGGNITLKMAGEEGAHPVGNLDSVIAVSPPLDLAECVEIITAKENKLFDAFFVKKLQQGIKKVHQFFPEMKLPHFPRHMNLYQFDDLYTAPRSGYANANDYYTQCSSKYFLDKIRIPTFILHAKDDPLIGHSSFMNIPLRSNLDLLITEYGGHIGWLSALGSDWNCRWMDKIVVKWVKWFDQHTT